MDSTYLRNTVGTALCDGLAAVALENPEDPVDFLGHWLLKYLAKQHVEKAAIDAEMNAVKSAELAVEDEKQSLKLEADVLAAKEKKIENIANATKTKLMWANLINVLRENTPAVNVYTSLFEKKIYAEGEEKPEEEAEEEPAPEEPPAEEGGEEEPELDEDGNPVMDEDGNPVMRKKESQVQKEKPLPKIPKSFILKYNAANAENGFLIGRQLNRKQGPVTFSAVDGRTGVLVPNIFECDKPIFFHDMPLPGSYMCRVFMNPDKSILGVVHADTMGGDGTFGTKDEQFFIKAVDALTAAYDRLVTQVTVVRARETEELISAWNKVAPTEEEAIADDAAVETIDEKVQLGIEVRLAEAARLFTEKITEKSLETAISPEADDEPLNPVAIAILGAAVAIVRGSKEEPLTYEQLLDASNGVSLLGNAANFIETALNLDVKAKRVRKSYQVAKMLLRAIPPPGHGVKAEGSEDEGGEAPAVVPLTILDAADAGMVFGVLFTWAKTVIELSDKNVLARSKEANAEPRGEDEPPQLVEIDLEEETERERIKQQKELAAQQAAAASEEQQQQENTEENPPPAEE